MGRACACCHAAKVKCIRLNDDDDCDRCKRLSLVCSPHESRQGQGPRRTRKRSSKDQDNVSATGANGTPLSDGTESSVGIMPAETHCNDCAASADDATRMCPGRLTDDSTNGVSAAMNALVLEDEVVCKSIQGLGNNHFGLHHLIRQWVSLSFTRRSYHLLSRAAFVAARCGISMDEIMSNQSPFATMTNSQPMDFLPACILLPKEQQNVLGPRLQLQELPWDFLQAMRVDPRLDETTRNRWIFLRCTTYGKCRFYASPLFQRDFATLDEIESTWITNKQEINDLWLVKSDKKALAQQFFNVLYLNKEPNMPVFVFRNAVGVRLRTSQDVLQADSIYSMKLVDMDTSYNFFEIQIRPNGENAELLLGDTTSGGNKRDRAHLMEDHDPLMDDDFEYTELPMTDELEEWLNLLGDPKQPPPTNTTVF